MADYRVAVLMSTYNGEKYIRRQIDSILEQRSVDVSLHVRDDGSSDSTVEILKEYASRCKNIEYYIGEKNLRPCGSFFELMSKVYDADYYALADQDDVWDNDKLICGIEMLRGLPNDKPALYYSNLRIVDSEENYIRKSHSVPRGGGGKYSYLSDVLTTGCTAIYNQSMAAIAVRIKPKRFSSHDTWLYCVASIFGNCVYDFQPHVSYRQHGANVVGTSKQRIGLEGIKREFRKYFNYKSQPRLLCANELISQFHDEIDKDTYNKIMEIVDYKKSIRNTVRVMLDKDFDSEDKYRRLRFKIKVLLRNI